MDKLAQLDALVRVRRMFASGEARRLRTSLDLSLKKTAEPAGIDPSTVHRWETGERVPNGPEALRYLRVLDALSALHGRVAS